MRDRTCQIYSVHSYGNILSSTLFILSFYQNQYLFYCFIERNDKTKRNSKVKRNAWCFILNLYVWFTDALFIKLYYGCLVGIPLRLFLFWKYMKYFRVYNLVKKTKINFHQLFSECELIFSLWKINFVVFLSNRLESKQFRIKSIISERC